VDNHGNFQELRLARDADSTHILNQLSQSGKLHHFEVTKPSLQDIFMRIVGKDKLETEQVGA
jgi:ABC-type uncharacterized transport system ATPase subunit